MGTCPAHAGECKQVEKAVPKCFCSTYFSDLSGGQRQRQLDLVINPVTAVAAKQPDPGRRQHVRSEQRRRLSAV